MLRHSMPRTLGGSSKAVEDRIKEEVVFGEYRIRILRMHGESLMTLNHLEVFLKDVRVFSYVGGRLNVGYNWEDAAKGLDNQLIAVGNDVTGNGIPNLVVSEYSGGAHCCFTFHVFELGPVFKRVGQIEAGHGGYSHFKDLDGDSNLELLTNDWAFAYWCTSFADSPAPEVILRYQEGGYHFAVDLMRGPFLSSGELHSLAEEIKASPCWRGSMAGGLEERTIAMSQPRTRCTDGGVIPLRLWEEMLHLIYGGNADQAWELFERAWPSDLPDKREALTDFRKTLAQSIYWEDLKELNVGLQ